MVMKTSNNSLSQSNITASNEYINVFLVGNNPIEMGPIYKYLSVLKKNRIIAEFCFDIKDSFNRILKMQPSCILLDDTLSKHYIKKLIQNLRNHRRTRDIPITLLKSNNHREVVANGIQDFLLKENLSADRLWKTILNSIKFKRNQRILNYIYYKRKTQAGRYIQSIRDKVGI